MLCALDLRVRFPREAGDLVEKLERRVGLLRLLELRPRRLQLRKQLFGVLKRIGGGAQDDATRSRATRASTPLTSLPASSEA